MTYKIKRKGKTYTMKSKLSGFKTWIEAYEFAQRKGLKNVSYGYNKKEKHFIKF
jgi:hypothetical protein